MDCIALGRHLLSASIALSKHVLWDGIVLGKQLLKVAEPSANAGG